MENNIEQPNTPPSLTIADLNLLKHLLEVTAERGAYKANELRTVGEVYNKLAAFLELIAQSSEAAQSENSQGESQ